MPAGIEAGSLGRHGGSSPAGIQRTVGSYSRHQRCRLDAIQRGRNGTRHCCYGGAARPTE